MSPSLLFFGKDTSAKSSSGGAIVAIVVGIILFIIIIYVIPYYNPYGLYDAIASQRDYLSSIGIILAIVMALSAIVIGGIAISRTRK